MRQEQYADAVSAYRKAYELAPERVFLSKTATALKAGGKPDESIDLMRQWLKQHPDDLAIRLGLATQLQTMERPGEALKEYEQIAQAEPKSVVALNNMAWLYQQQGDLKKARSLAEKAYELAPQVPGVIDTYGWILANSSEVERALTLLEEAVAKSNGQADIRYHLAAAHALAGNTGRARSDLEALLAEQSAFAEREAASQLLERLR